MRLRPMRFVERNRAAAFVVEGSYVARDINGKVSVDRIEPGRDVWVPFTL